MKRIEEILVEGEPRYWDALSQEIGIMVYQALPYSAERVLGSHVTVVSYKPTSTYVGGVRLYKALRLGDVEVNE